MSVLRAFPNPDNIPDELRAIHQWCLWRYEEDAAGRISKPSYQALSPLERAWPNDPETWGPFNAALDAYMFGRSKLPHSVPMDGIAIVLSTELGIVGVDLDHLDRWERRSDAWGIVRQLSSYTEMSPSGDGYRIFVYATMPAGRRRREYVEMFGTGRIFTVTGNTLGVSRRLEHRQAELEAVHHQWLGTDYARGKR